MDQITIVPNTLSKEECAQILTDAGFDRQLQRIAPFDYNDYNNLERRRMNGHPIVKTLAEKMCWNVAASPCIWYPAGSSNSMHSDNSINDNGVVVKMTDWTHSVIIFLNDTFEGGELIYPDQGLTVKPTIGTMVVAPAGIEFPHYVTVTSSDRYVLVLRLI